jgi:protein gp37
MSKIQWTDITENPIHLIRPDGSHGGHWCQKISPGCANCYAEAINQSNYFGFASHLPYSGPAPDNLHFDRKMIDRWAKARSPKKRFICSMTDLFGDWVPIEWQHEIFDAAAAAPGQTIQLLTKRPEIAAKAMEDWCHEHGKAYIPENVWMGVSIEDQKTAHDRLGACIEWPLWCKTPWISYEPALSYVDFRPYFDCGFRWIVVGGESGPGSRLCDLDWFHGVAVTATDCNVALFMKQLGAAMSGVKTRDRKGGDITEFPFGLQRREFPALIPF